MGTLTPHRRILVVDDDIRATRVFVRMLREDGFDVEVAYDGATAIGWLSRPSIPDVLITDIQMPHADGFAVAEYARSRKPGLPIFLVTGYPERITLRVKQLDPVPQVFTKPFDYAVLAMKLSDASLMR